MALNEATIRRIIREELEAALDARDQRVSLTIQEAVEATGISREKIDLARRRGTLRASYPSSRAVYETAELRRWVRSLPDEPA